MCYNILYNRIYPLFYNLTITHITGYKFENSGILFRSFLIRLLILQSIYYYIINKYFSNCYYDSKKTTIEVKLLKGSGYQVMYSKESEELQTAMDLLSQSYKRLRVKYNDRKAFLAPFIPLLIDPRKKHGLKHVNHFAKMMHLLVDFIRADEEAKNLNVECIADEIYKLYNELYPKKQEDFPER